MKKVNVFIICLFGMLYLSGQVAPINTFDYSNPLTPGQNVLLPDSSNQLWQVGKSAKFDGVLSTKPALYTDTLNSYPINVDEGVTMVLYDEYFGLAYHWYDVFFTHRFDTDSLSDGAYIELSLDSGATWVNVVDYTDSVVWPADGPYSIDFYNNSYLVNGQRSAFTGSGKAFRQNSIWIGLIVAVVAKPEMVDFPVAPYLRFSFVSDSVDNQKAGWQIDEVEIWGTVTSGIPERVNPITISPNPSNGVFEIQSRNHSQLNFMVSNAIGQNVYHGKMNGTQAKVDLSSFPPGSYFLTFENGNSIKLIKR
jgi:hypothetical protein